MRAGSARATTGSSGSGRALQLHPLAGRQGHPRRDDLRRQRPEVDLLQVERQRAGVEPGQLQLLLHQPLEPRGLLAHRREELAPVALAHAVALEELEEPLERRRSAS